MHTYANPWHDPQNREYGPEEYTTHATHEQYRGFQIFHRVMGSENIKDGSHVFDVVRGGVCITQRAGPDGARRAIDELLDDSITPDKARLLAWSLGATEWRAVPNRKNMRHLMPPLIYFTKGLNEIGHWNEAISRLVICDRRWGESVAAEHYTVPIRKPVHLPPVKQELI